MPLLGAHFSTAGGFHKAIELAVSHACGTFQMFVSQPRVWPVTPRPPSPAALRSGKLLTKNSNQWQGKPLSEEDTALFRRLLRRSKLKYATAHDSYLINLASPDDVLYRKSIDAFVDEVNRAEQLGLRYLVMHPGAHMDSGEDEGLRRVAAALDEVHERCAGFGVKVLLETTAGQGTCLGHRFEHLARIIELVRDRRRLGVCLDTCHVFAAGYPLAPARDYEATLNEFDRTVGLSRLRCFHVNDSKKPLGFRVDRHEHIGRGCLGLEPFRLLLNDPRFCDRPMILETPKEDGDNPDMDAVNLKTLRNLIKD